MAGGKSVTQLTPGPPLAYEQEWPKSRMVNGIEMASKDFVSDSNMGGSKGTYSVSGSIILFVFHL